MTSLTYFRQNLFHVPLGGQFIFEPLIRVLVSRFLFNSDRNFAAAIDVPFVKRDLFKTIVKNGIFK
jgi:hypothetical protein